MSYFVSGLWHFAAAMAFAATFGVFKSGDYLYYLQDPAFTIPLLVTSSACFFVPEKYARKGLMKFLHYPLPDWDVLFLGPASHRNWITHSAILPLLTLAAVWKWPNLATIPSFESVCVGSCIGTGSHLFWDCVGSQRHKIVVVPYWFALREGPSRLWLLLGAALCLCIGGAFASLQKLGL